MAVKIIARGVYFDLGTTLQEKATYRITGRGQMGKQTGKIILKSATPVAAQPETDGAGNVADSIPKRNTGVENRDIADGVVDWGYSTTSTPPGARDALPSVYRT